MSQITTHVLDTVRGTPATNLKVELSQKSGTDWKIIASGATDSNGRVNELLEKEKILPPGTYRIIFETAAYFKNLNLKTFYPEIIICFEVTDGSHYHVPLLLSAYGYTTYRGS